MSRITAGVLAGLMAGVVFGVMMQVMMAPTPDGGRVPMMAMVARVVKSNSLVVGWLYHLFNSAVIGALFGVLLGSRSFTYGSGLIWGGLYGLGWWILGGLILMPLLLGMPAFAPLMMEPMRRVALGSLVGHLVYGLILGAGVVWLTHQATPTGHVTPASGHRAYGA
jgi:hypothetical protein